MRSESSRKSRFNKYDIKNFLANINKKSPDFSEDFYI